MNCPCCKVALDLKKIGAVIQATAELPTYKIIDIEGTLEYYCKECGNKLPKEEVEKLLLKKGDED